MLLLLLLYDDDVAVDAVVSDDVGGPGARYLVEDAGDKSGR
jgi:hypothetical protein